MLDGFGLGFAPRLAQYLAVLGHGYPHTGVVLPEYSFQTRNRSLVERGCSRQITLTKTDQRHISENAAVAFASGPDLFVNCQRTTQESCVPR